MTAAPTRRVWLDWVRGLAVIIMVLSHVVDAWTRDADRTRTAFYWSTFVGGIAAPAFLFLAGLGTSLSGTAKLRAGLSRASATRALLRRGWIIFGLAFLFRLQSFVLGLGAPVGLLKVDILNVMGLSLVVGAALWGAAATTAGRVALASAAAGAVAMAAPLVRSAPGLDTLPSVLQWYLRPDGNHSNFTLFPWAAFAFAGMAVGAALGAIRDPRDERRLLLTLAVLAGAGTAAAYWASLQPTIYPPGASAFWGASPTFFAIRLGFTVALLPLMWALRRRMPAWLGAALATLGAASLFAYWVHVELVYGGIAILIKRRLPLELSLVATVAASYGLVRLIPRARVWVTELDRRPVVLKRLAAKLL
ncbi:MAG: heparan-alpha-glucosaminide N-acetyltransferase domain-containing protein [Acidobacteriota bacterium]